MQIQPKRETRLQVRVSLQQKAQLQRIAKEHSATVSEVIRAIVQEFLDKYSASSPTRRGYGLTPTG